MLRSLHESSSYFGFVPLLIVVGCGSAGEVAKTLEDSAAEADTAATPLVEESSSEVGGAIEPGEDGEAANYEPPSDEESSFDTSPSNMDSTSSIPPTSEDLVSSGEATELLALKSVRDEFWETTGAGESSQVWFGLSGDSLLALEVSDDGGSGVTSFSLWEYDYAWAIEPSFEFDDCCALWNKYGSIRFFDATGNGIEDIVLNYFGGKRMTGNVFTVIDGAWVDTGTFQRPEYAQPGHMRITYQSCDPSCAEGDDISSWGYWTGAEWKPCDDPEAPDDCDFYWTGG